MDAEVHTSLPKSFQRLEALWQDSVLPPAAANQSSRESIAASRSAAVPLKLTSATPLDNSYSQACATVPRAKMTYLAYADLCMFLAKGLECLFPLFLDNCNHTCRAVEVLAEESLGKISPRDLLSRGTT